MPQEVVEERFDTDIFEVAIYRTPDLDDSRENLPEYTIVNHLSPALSELRINHRIRWDFEPQPIVNNDTSCNPDRGALFDWRPFVNDGRVPFRAADSNLLLTSAGGGGCGGIGGNTAVVGAIQIDFAYERHMSGTEPWKWHVYNALHEIGHNMGWGHVPSPGMAFIDDNDQMNITPTLGSNDGYENLCGETVPPRPDNGKLRIPHLYYHDCVANHIQIVGPSPGTVEIIDLELSDSPVEVGDTVTITATMENTTTDRVQRDEPVLVGDARIDTLHFDVPSDSTQSLSTTYQTDTVGEFIVQVNQGVETLVVEEETVPPADIQVVDVSVSPESPTVGETAEIAVTARNFSEGGGRRNVNVLAQGNVVGTVVFDMDGAGINREFSEQTATLAWLPQSPGDYLVDAGEASTTVTVQEPNGGGNGNGDEGGGGPVRGGAEVLPWAVIGAGAIYLLHQYASEGKVGATL